MKSLFLILTVLFCTHSSIAQSLLASVSTSSPVVHIQSYSHIVTNESLPSIPDITHQAAGLVGGERIISFLASDAFAVIGVLLAVIAGLLWFFFFTDLYRLTSHERKVVH